MAPAENHPPKRVLETETNEMKCEGPACGVVDVYWDDSESGYRLRNFGTRPVLVSLASASGEVSVRLEPGGDDLIHLAEFDLPYRAFFCDSNAQFTQDCAYGHEGGQKP